MEIDDHLSSTFAALADVTRRNILHRLQNGPLTVSELAAHYPISRPAISQHLAVLEKAGLVQRNRRAQWSECSLTDDGLKSVADWIATQQAAWDQRFDRLEEHLSKEKPDE